MASEPGTARVGPLSCSVVCRVRRPPSGRRGAVADDARAREVGPRHSSWEAGEQSGTARSRAICSEAECSGAGGAKVEDRGECMPAKHAPDAESGKRITGTVTHTESGE